VIRVDDVHAIRAIASAAHIQFVPRLHHCIARYNETDRLLGGVLFTEYRGGSVAIHMAGFDPHWVNRAMIYLAFDYPFNQLKVKKLIGLVPESNERARNANLKLGFTDEYLIADIYDGPVNGMYIMSMLKDQCRWLDMPMPFIEYAPPERTNNINLSLASMPTVGVMQ
jgi:RimJ/RimL family protein N-acetyltransferase